MMPAGPPPAMATVVVTTCGRVASATGSTFASRGVGADYPVVSREMGGWNDQPMSHGK